MTRLWWGAVAGAALGLVIAGAPAAGQVAGRPRPIEKSAEQPARRHYARGVRTTADPGRATTAAVQWEPFVGMDDQIFPSFILSTATMRLPQEEDEEADPFQLGEDLGFIGAAITGVPVHATLRVEIKPNTIIDRSVFEGSATAGAGDYQVFPKINYRFDALLGWRQPGPLNITMDVSVNGRSYGSRSLTVTVRSLNDCPLAIVSGEDSDDEDLDLSWMFAAYVNENHPWVDTVTREALDSKIVDGFTAYQDGDSESVLRQVYAIWHTLQQRGMRYSDISQSSAESEVVVSQHVRLFDETINARQANCVDGTALLAAVLRKIGIQPYLVAVPGHMFLAFDLDEEGENTVGLETTMMGDTVAGPARSRHVPSSLVDRYRSQPSMKTFVAAIEEGTKQLEKDSEKFESEDPEYQIISLAEARKLGILPLAYRQGSGAITASSPRK
jgi:hypothetical protein